MDYDSFKGQVYAKIRECELDREQILITVTVGIFQLRNDEKVKNETFKILLIEILKNLPLLKKLVTK